MTETVKKTMAERLSVLPTMEKMDEMGLKTTAQKIRHCASINGDDRGAIAKHLGIKYQWVRNVMITPVKG
jgi:hypothetical protein